MTKGVTKILHHIDRLLLVKLKTDPVDLLVIQVYIPTSAYKDEDIDKFYDEMEELIEAVNESVNLFNKGHRNAVINEKDVGSFGQLRRNSRMQRFVEFG